MLGCANYCTIPCRDSLHHGTFPLRLSNNKQEALYRSLVDILIDLIYEQVRRKLNGLPAFVS